jgi:beta-lactamase regulating signal transducer with metallopeptidase domain
MTAIRPALEFFVDANILFALAFLIWKVSQTLIARSRLRHDYAARLRLLKAALVVTVLSPILAQFAALAGRNFWPETPITVSDVAVAAYLRGDIALPAATFEALLNTRSRIFEALFSGDAVWPMIILGLATAGACVQAIRTAMSLAQIRATIVESHLWRRTARTDIRLSDTVGVPFVTRGLFRRHIVLPSSLVTHPRHMRYILAHECQHCREGDVEWELVFECFRPLMFWNPAFVLWKRDFDRLRELGCDQSVIARRDIPFRDYSRCLLDFCQRRVCGSWPTPMQVAFVRPGRRAARRDLEARILALHEAPGKDRRHFSTGLVFAFLLVALMLAATSLRQSADWSHDRLMLSTIVNLERLEVINSAFR